jgi:type IV pilus assembly protein PilE
MRSARGFTFYELMIVVAIIGILSAIAYPNYTRYLMRSWRADAQQFMQKLDARQRQVLIEQRTYATTPAALNVSSSGWTCSSNCTNGKYTIAFNPAVNMAATPPSYTICATPSTAQAPDGVLTLTSTGVKQRLTGGTPTCTSGTDVGW